MQAADAFALPAHSRRFHRSSRPFLVRLTLLGLGTYLFLWLVVGRIGSRASLAITLAAAAVAVLWFLVTRYWRFGIRIDREGIHDFGSGRRRTVPWADLAGVEIAESSWPRRSAAVRVRYALVSSRAGEQIAFSDLALIGGESFVVQTPQTVPVRDVADSDVLLAIVATRAGSIERFTGIVAAPPVPPELAAAAPEGVAARAAAGRVVTVPARRVSVLGLFALFAKVGGKLLTGIVTALKTVKPGLALATTAVYASIFSWQGILLMLMLFVHEYGHVFAMRRVGMRVRGIYFIPFVGAAAVTEDAWKSRSEQAYVALNGPFWGACLTLVLIGIHWATAGRYPWLMGQVGIWAAINLFNLLPVNPLDGGRVLSAIGFSLHSALGFAASLLAIAAATLLATLAGFGLFAVIALIGLFEFLAEYGASRRAADLRLAGAATPLGATALLRLRAMTRPLLPAEQEMRLQLAEAQRMRRVEQLAQVVPMRAAQMGGWAIAYLGLSVSLAAMLLWSLAHPAARAAFGLFGW